MKDGTLFIQYSSEITFDYSTGRFPNGTESVFKWEEYYTPVNHDLDGVVVGPHVWRREKIGANGTWSNPQYIAAGSPTTTLDSLYVRIDDLKTSGEAEVHWDNITDIPNTASGTHNNLSSKQGGGGDQFYHLTNAQHTGLTAGNNTTLHHHDARYLSVVDMDARYYTKTNLQTSGSALVHWGNITNVPTALSGIHNDLQGLQGGTTAERYHLYALDITNLTELTDGSETVLHSHPVLTTYTLTIGAGLQGTDSSFDPVTANATISPEFSGTGGDYGTSTDLARADHSHAVYAVPSTIPLVLEENVTGALNIIALTPTIAFITGKVVIGTAATYIATIPAEYILDVAFYGGDFRFPIVYNLISPADPVLGMAYLSTTQLLGIDAAMTEDNTVDISIMYQIAP